MASIHLLRGLEHLRWPHAVQAAVLSIRIVDSCDKEILIGTASEICDRYTTALVLKGEPVRDL
jgi:hypothetical protein